MIRPSSITMIMSASRIVDRRWAMTKLVRFDLRAAMAFCTRTSVRVSTELVASSRSNSEGDARKARAIVTSCRSPALRLLASSSITVS